MNLIIAMIAIILLQNVVYLPYVQAEPEPVQQDEWEALYHINIIRQNNGCKPLILDGRLQKAALDHTKYMINDDVFEHSNLYRIFPDYGYQWSQLAENLGYGYPTGYDMAIGWRDSPDHFRHMVNCAYTDTGIVHRSERWTLLLGRP